MSSDPGYATNISDFNEIFQAKRTLSPGHKKTNNLVH